LTADNERLLAQNEQERQEIENWKRKYEQLERQRIADLDMMKQDYEKRVRDSPVKISLIKSYSFFLIDKKISTSSNYR